jgi:Mor family transcriptional regulator
MGKPIIDAKQALEDIRAGMDNAALMKKYNLSARGLASLFRELSSIGAIRWLKARSILSDIKEGMCDADLIEKYKLSSAGLESLFSELAKAGISVSSRNQARTRNKRQISQPQIVHDIHAGMSETELMEKYELSSWGLQRVLGKLLATGAITWQEMAVLSLKSEDSVTLRDMRQHERSYPLVSMVVYEQAKPRIKGKVRDLSEKGLGVIGIPSEVDDLKTLTIAPHELTVFEPFTLQAACRWFRKGDLDITGTAGFAITHIEESSLEQLRYLLESFASTLPG